MILSLSSTLHFAFYFSLLTEVYTYFSLVLIFVNYNPPTKGTSLFTKKHDDNLNPSSNSLSIADLYLFKFSNKLTMIYQMYVLSRYISI